MPELDPVLFDPFAHDAPQPLIEAERVLPLVYDAIMASGPEAFAPGVVTIEGFVAENCGATYANTQSDLRPTRMLRLDTWRVVGEPPCLRPLRLAVPVHRHTPPPSPDYALAGTELAVSVRLDRTNRQAVAMGPLRLAALTDLLPARAEALRPFEVTSDSLGTLVFDPSFEGFVTQRPWLGHDVELVLAADESSPARPLPRSHDDAVDLWAREPWWTQWWAGPVRQAVNAEIGEWDLHLETNCPADRLLASLQPFAVSVRSEHVVEIDAAFAEPPDEVLPSVRVEYWRAKARTHVVFSM